MQPLPIRFRTVAVGLLALAVCLCQAERPTAEEPPAGDRPRMEQAAPPEEPPPPPAELKFVRGAGGGLALLTLGLWCLVVVGWTASTDWAARDERRTPDFQRLWLPLLAFPFFVVAVASWWLPWSLAALPLTFIAWFAPLAAYVRHRDAGAPAEDRLWSYANLRLRLEPLAKRLGVTLPKPAPPLGEILPEIRITTAADRAGTGSPEAGGDLPGHAEFCRLVQRACAARAERVEIDRDKAGTRVNHFVDGVLGPARRFVSKKEGKKRVEVWEEMPPLTREEGKALLRSVEEASGLDGDATGHFEYTVGTSRVPCTVRRPEGHGGRRLVIDIGRPRPRFRSLAELGMPESVAAAAVTTLGYEQGIVLVAAPAGEGLTTTFAQLLNASDRLCREFAILESATDSIGEIQNVEPYRWGDGGAFSTPAEALAAARRKYPNVICLPRLDAAPELAAELATAATELLVIVGVRAAGAPEAIEAALAGGIPRDVAARTLLASLGERLLRKLCAGCAESYTPSAKELAKLKLPTEAGELKKPAAAGCVQCGGSGYLGRTGVFQFASGPMVAKAVARGVDLKMLEKAAAHDGMESFKEAGLRLIAAGITCRDELKRVLKQD